MQESPEEEAKEQFDKALLKLKRTTMTISRIPEKYKTRFMQIAKEEFADDWGMTLREMVRTWDGIYLDPNEELKIKLDMLANEISQIKEELKKIQAEPEKKNQKVMADGTVRTIGGENK